MMLAGGPRKGVPPSRIAAGLNIGPVVSVYLPAQYIMSVFVPCAIMFKCSTAKEELVKNVMPY
jgi:hypothetical protein